MISSFQWTAKVFRFEVLSSISSAEDTTPLRGVKAKPCGCSAALRSLDTPSLAWSEVLALMEKRKKHVCFLTSYEILANRKSCIPRNFDRVEVHSPGLLLPGITVEQMERGEVQSKLRNPVLAGLLSNIPGYIEQIGSGVRFMLDETKRLELPAPHFREMSEFMVTFQKAPALRTPEQQIQYQEKTLWEGSEASLPEIVVQDRRAEQVELRLIQALQYVQEHGFITNGIYRQLTGVTDRTAHRDLERLVERGRLKGTGQRAARRYVLA